MDRIDTLTPTDDFMPSTSPKGCVLCHHPIEGEDARVMIRTVGFEEPRHFPGAGVQTYYIRRHFINHP